MFRVTGCNYMQLKIKLVQQIPKKPYPGFAIWLTCGLQFIFKLISSQMWSGETPKGSLSYLCIKKKWINKYIFFSLLKDESAHGRMKGLC